jgi:hypothetical protein
LASFQILELAVTGKLPATQQGVLPFLIYFVAGHPPLFLLQKRRAIRLDIVP